MSSLEITLDQAKQFYPSASGGFKTLLEEKFGKEKLILRPVMERIKTWEDAAAEKGYDSVNGLPFPQPKNNREIATNAFFMADVITEVLLDGVILRWDDSKQKKWGFWLNEYTPGSGFRFLVTCYGWTLTGAAGGARLYLDTEEKVRYFGKQFLPIINQLSNPVK